jgi:pimeloyl-ACP methyl ester carboxylesterase
MLAGLPVKERRVEIAGTATAVLEGGEGPPMMLVHGGIECGGAIWSPVVVELARRYRLVIPDLPGLGMSDPVPRLDPEAFAAWLDNLIQLTCDEPPALVAHSIGGNYALRFAATREGSLSRLILCSAPGVGAYRIPLGLRVVAIRFALRPTAENSERFERFALLDRARTRELDPDWFDAFSSYALERARTKHVKRTMGQLIKFGTRRIDEPDLEPIQAPVGVIWGRGDRMTPLSVASPAVERLGWPLQVVDDAAHVPHLEQPERFLGCLGRIFARPLP